MQDTPRELTPAEVQAVSGGLPIGPILTFIGIADLIYDFAKGVSDGYSDRAN